MKNQYKWRILRILTTNDCNYRCIYCHNEGQKNKNQNMMITFEQFIRYFSIAYKLGVEEVRFSGGEPLVNKDVIKMIEWLDRNSLVEIGLATNGSLVSEEIADCLSKTRIMVTLHFPGVGTEAYNKVTGGSWKNFEKCVQLFDKYKIDYSFNYTLYPETISSIFDVINYTVEKKKRVKLLPFLESGFNNFSAKYIENIVSKLSRMKTTSIYLQDEGYYLFEFKNGAAVKIINSPCYLKNIDMCKRYGEIRLLPDLSLKNCIFGKTESTLNLNDEDILKLFQKLLNDMCDCNHVILKQEGTI